jgi:Na+/proline symporter
MKRWLYRIEFYSKIFINLNILITSVFLVSLMDKHLDINYDEKPSLKISIFLGIYCFAVACILMIFYIHLIENTVMDFRSIT